MVLVFILLQFRFFKKAIEVFEKNFDYTEGKMPIQFNRKTKKIDVILTKILKNIKTTIYALKEGFEVENFVFSFKLATSKNCEEDEEQALVNMIKNNLESILNVVELTYEERVIQVDGFKFINSFSKTYNLFK